MSSYSRGATNGRNLGRPGYSYDFVVQLFEPLFRELGEYVLVENAEDELESAVEEARRRGLQPVHFCFRGVQDAIFSESAPNVIVPAWEFPDVPDHAFDDEPRNDWVRTAERSDVLMVHGEFTRDAFARGGTKANIQVVPVPIPDRYFETGDWKPGVSTRFETPVVVLGGCRPEPQPPERTTAEELASPSVGESSTAGRGTRSRAPRFVRWSVGVCRAIFRSCLRPLVSRRVERIVKVAVWAILMETFERVRPTEYVTSEVELSGVVYTSIFNAADNRKNWQDLVTAFLTAHRHRSDATLVLKLVGCEDVWLRRVISRFASFDEDFACRIVVLKEFLTDAQMQRLQRITTFYATSTRAEGNCLPLMDHLAAGRPGISPRHTAISDYFSDEIGFVVESHPEPCCWPHDAGLRTKTTWHRLVWPSLVEAFEESYRVAKEDASRYERLAGRAREIVRSRLHPAVVLPRLRRVIDAALASRASSSEGRSAA